MLLSDIEYCLMHIIYLFLFCHYSLFHYVTDTVQMKESTSTLVDECLRM